MNDFDARWLIGAAMIVVFLLLLLALRAGWRAKARAQADIAAPPAAGAVTGELIAAFDDVHYVATTLDERPLERVVSGPLAFRGRCQLEVRADGVRVTVRGTEPFSIPLATIEAIGARTATIDRAVERDGLTSITWRLGAGERAAQVHSSFRVVDRTEREQVNAALHTMHANQSTNSEESR